MTATANGITLWRALPPRLCVGLLTESVRGASSPDLVADRSDSGVVHTLARLHPLGESRDSGDTLRNRGPSALLRTGRMPLSQNIRII